MASSADDQSGRRSPDVDDEIEEGEFVPGYGYDTGSDTDTDDEQARYFLQPHHDTEDLPGVRLRRLEDIVAGGCRQEAMRSPTSSYGSDVTISDGSVNTGAAAAFERVLFPCPVCPREFGSKKAVHGHMRVHAQGQDKGKEKERPAVVVSGGSTKEEMDDSMAIVVAEPKLPVVDEPMPMPVVGISHILHGSSSSNAEPNHSESSMAIVVAAPNPSNQPPPAAPQQVAVQRAPAAPQQVVVPPPAAAPPQQAVVPPPAVAPQQVAVQPPAAAPQQVVVPPPAAPQQAVVPAPAAPQQIVVHPPDGPLHIIAHHDPAAPPAGGNEGLRCKECSRWFPTHQGLGGHVAGHKIRRMMREAAAAAGGNDGFRCKECSRWFPTHQGLGGHVAGHKIRRMMREAAAAAASGVVIDAGAAACRGGAKPKQVHVCSKCGQMYPSGVSLGGHMRKHYNGPPIVPKKRPRVEPAPSAPPVEVAPQPAQPPVAGSVRIFGVTIVQPQEDSSGGNYKI